jgi:hemoglobin
MYTPPIDPRSIAAPSREIYAAMGEDAIVRMIHDLYAELEQSSIRPMFGRDMHVGAERSAAFFIGLLGGPPRYHERYGNPMMRARHMPFPIDMDARDVWLACFDRVLADAPARYGFPAEHLPGFRTFLVGFATWMTNQENGQQNERGIGNGE